jgi:hypothetical protein
LNAALLTAPGAEGSEGDSTRILLILARPSVMSAVTFAAIEPACGSLPASVIITATVGTFIAKKMPGRSVVALTASPIAHMPNNPAVIGRVALRNRATNVFATAGVSPRVCGIGPGAARVPSPIRGSAGAAASAASGAAARSAVSAKTVATSASNTYPRPDTRFINLWSLSPSDTRISRMHWKRLSSAT